MRIIWDEPKRLANLAKHHYDFRDLAPEFFETALIIPSRLGRSIAIGWHEGTGIVVIHMVYGSEAVSVIPMRDANPKERRNL